MQYLRGHMCSTYRIMNENGDLFCRFVWFLIILSSCQTLCAIYFGQALCLLTCNDALKETDNKRALYASFPAWYYRAQWSITCRDMAVYSGLTHGHNIKEVPPCSTPKLISPDYILDFLRGIAALLFELIDSGYEENRMPSDAYRVRKTCRVLNNSSGLTLPFCFW